MKDTANYLKSKLKTTYEEDNTHVENSYLATDISFEVGYIIRERYIRHLPQTRKFDSYVREWKAHNNLYKLGLFKSHTKDVDLEEPIKWYYELIYWLIGR